MTDNGAASQKLVFERNDKYNGPRPALAKSMTWQVLPDDTTRTNAMTSGSVQAIDAVPAANLKTLKDPVKVAAQQGFGLLFAMFNNTTFSNVKARQAVLYALTTDGARAARLAVAEEVHPVADEPDLDGFLTQVHTPEFVAAVKAASADPDHADQAFGLGTEDDPAFRGIHETSARIAVATRDLCKAVWAGEGDHGARPRPVEPDIAVEHGGRHRDLADLRLPEGEESDTLGGLIAEILNQMPEPGDRIELDAGDKGRIPERLRHQGRKQPGPDARFDDAAAAPAEPFETLPDRADDELRREMSILRAAGERGVVGLVHARLQLFAKVVPPLAESRLARPGEDRIGEIGGAKTGEADESILLVPRRWPVLGRDRRGQGDGIEIGAGAGLPALGRQPLGDLLQRRFRAHGQVAQGLVAEGLQGLLAQLC